MVKSSIKIAIIIRTGRINYKNVVRDLVKSLQLYGHLDRYKFDLYISVDDKMKNIEQKVFKLNGNTESIFDSVKYIFNEDRKIILQVLTDNCISPRRLSKIILLREPYGHQINSALIYAISKKNDIALHFDDDQGFAVPIAINGKLKWNYMDVVGWHIKGLKNGALITTGPIAGFVSAITPHIVNAIPENTRRELGRLFEQTHEFAGEHTFLYPKSRILSELDSKKSKLVPIAVHRGYRWISPANMGINLQMPFPVFYNPKGARGEDTFFAMGIDRNALLYEIPAFIFHDPFLSHPGIYEDRFPDYLVNEPLSPKSIKRFSDMIFGWIKYMSLFMRIRFHDNLELYKQILNNNKEIINRVSGELATCLRHEEFLKMPNYLDDYNQRVEIDYQDWIKVNSTWEKNILPWVQKNHPNFER